MPGNQSATQALLQNLTNLQTNAQAGAQRPGSSPNTAYNFAIPTQTNAAGQWWTNHITLPSVPNNYTPEPYVVDQKVQYPTSIPVPQLAAWQRPGDAPLPSAVTNLLNFYKPHQLPLPVNQPLPTGTPPPAAGGTASPPPPATIPVGTVGGPISQLPIPSNGTGVGAFMDDMNRGGGEFCVEADSYLSNFVQAKNVDSSFVAYCHSPEVGFHEHKVEEVNPAVLQDCVQLVTGRGASIIVSTSTPFNFIGASSDLKEGEWAYAPDMLNQFVYVYRNGVVTAEKVIFVAMVGKKHVVPLGFGGRSFPAGLTSDALIYSHNIMKAKSGWNNINRMQNLLDAYSFSQDNGMLPAGIGVLGSNPYGTPVANAPAPTAATATPTTSSYQLDANGNIIAVPLTQTQITNPNQTTVNPLSSIFNNLFSALDPNYTPDADGTINWAGNNSLGVPNDAASLGNMLIGLPVFNTKSP